MPRRSIGKCCIAGVAEFRFPVINTVRGVQRRSLAAGQSLTPHAIVNLLDAGNRSGVRTTRNDILSGFALRAIEIVATKVLALNFATRRWRSLSPGANVSSIGCVLDAMRCHHSAYRLLHAAHHPTAVSPPSVSGASDGTDVAAAHAGSILCERTARCLSAAATDEVKAHSGRPSLPQIPTIAGMSRALRSSVGIRSREAS
jgi:hypothetical protein